MASDFHVGIDLDNTIIDYDKPFVAAGAALGLLPPGHGCTGKGAVKALLLRGSAGEEAWMRLQGQVYGARIGGARLTPGVARFLKALRRRRVRISIVSHKTRYGHFDPARVDLWEAALGWLDGRGFFDRDGFALDRAAVHFLETRQEKIATIGRIGCDMFIDDLPEVLTDPGFPAGTVGLWYAGPAAVAAAHALVPHRNWTGILGAVDALRRGAATAPRAPSAPVCEPGNALDAPPRTMP